MKFKSVIAALAIGLLFSACKREPEVAPNTSVIPPSIPSINTTPISQPVAQGGAFADAQTINTRLGKGINIGDKFETQWTPGKFDINNYALIAAKGFKHVRIPITWDVNDRSISTAPYTIRPEFLATIKEQVDAALKNKLMVVIDMHHHDKAFSNPIGYKSQFIAEWKQISQYFHSYPDSLVFELLNEPHDKLDPDTWNTYFADGLAEVRKTNPERTVLMGVGNYGTIEGIKYVTLPTDPHLILTVHYYNPFPFTHQGAEWVEGTTAWLGTTWNDAEYERGIASNEIGQLVDFSKKYNIPIHIGEFGAYNMADMTSRVKWTRYMSRLFESKGFSWAYWEFDSGFGIFDPRTKQFKPELTKALLTELSPAPTPVSLTDIYTLNFQQGVNGGWNLLNNTSATKSTLVTSNGAFNLFITNPGQEEWHLQMRKFNIPIVRKKKYLVSFTASSNVSKEVTVSLQQNTTWKGYGYAPIVLNTVKDKYYAVITSSNSDSNATLTFSFGGKPAANILISDIKMQEFN